MNIGSRTNYYDVLELSPHSAQHELTTAYQRVKATYSGDNPAIYTIFSEQEARALLLLIEEAYSVLGNKNLRNIYDQRLLSGNFQMADLSYEAILNASKQMFPEPRQEEKKADYKNNPDFENEITSCKNWNGDLLRQVRDYKNITIRKMSDVTKINIYYITAIENMDLKSLPAPVFIRGYVVQMARLLGLDEKKVADSYMKLLKENTPQK
jgi:DnaJ-class molecular chaperone